MTLTKEDLPKYWQFIYPCIQAVNALGGSGHLSEVLSKVVELEEVSDEALDVHYDSGKPVLIDRIQWAITYSKIGGALDNPDRGFYTLTSYGSDLLTLESEEATALVRDANKERKKTLNQQKKEEGLTEDDPDESLDEEFEQEQEWRSDFLKRLHELDPYDFEQFCLQLLRAYGLILEPTGKSGDEGIDGLGTAPLSPVLSTTVAVQCKRYDPSKSSISRDQVALFQRDAAAKGAERAVMVTLGRYSKPAQKAATTTTPTVDLIDGEKVCDLAIEKGIGLKKTPQVDENWFKKRFG
tara:strand:- start:127 stop:1014 length:888 start_codon:yes stop_codon:yes gene_type:complete